MSSPIIEPDLGKILERIELNLAESVKESNKRFEQLQKDTTEIKVGLARLEERMTSVEGEVSEYPKILHIGTEPHISSLSSSGFTQNS